MMNALHYIPSDDNGIAFLEFDLPESKVNTLSESVMRELGDLLDGDLCSDKINMLAVFFEKILFKGEDDSNTIGKAADFMHSPKNLSVASSATAQSSAPGKCGDRRN